MVAAVAGIVAMAGAAKALPEIRTSPTNQVPACVTPARLMQFMEQRNPRLPAAWSNIAELYKQHGERLKVRWDYAFYQMLLETNFLTYRTGSGGWGDVNPRQNNFAGLGTTGGGVPGDSFRSASDGVLGQIQHLVAYSGEKVANPVAARTREVQDDVIALSRGLGRPVTFRDLAGRWAIDRAYGRSIEAIATRFRERFCNGEPEMQVADASAGGRGASSRRGSRRAAPVEETRSETPEEQIIEEVAAPARGRGQQRQARGSGSGAAPRSAAATPRGIEEMEEPPPTARAGRSRRAAAPEPEEAQSAMSDDAPQDGEEQVAGTDEPPADTEQLAADGDQPADGEARQAAGATSLPGPAGPPATAVPPRSAVVINGAGRGHPQARVAAPATPRPPAPARPAGSISELIERQAQAEPPRTCKVFTASYGGERNVLIQSTVGSELHLTALQVVDGQEEELTASYIEEHAKGGRRIGEVYPSREIALLHAFELCPRATRVTQQQ